jgi:hypothetical protein
VHSAARPTGWLRKGSWHTIRGWNGIIWVEPAVASVLAGVPLDRICLRPRWWPWLKPELSVVLEGHRVLEGRACSAEHRRVAVLTPYPPYPLARGGTVRIYHLVREMAEEFDVELFAFQDKSVPPKTVPVLEFCVRVVLVEKPRYASRAGLLCCRPTSASFDRRPCATHWRRSGERSVRPSAGGM